MTQNQEKTGMGRVGVKLHLRHKSFYTPLPSPAIVLAKTDTEKRF